MSPAYNADMKELHIRNRSSIPDTSRRGTPALGFTESHMQWVTGAISPKQSGRGVKLNIHAHLMSRSRMRDGTPPLPYTQTAVSLLYPRLLPFLIGLIL